MMGACPQETGLRHHAAQFSLEDAEVDGENSDPVEKSPSRAEKASRVNRKKRKTPPHLNGSKQMGVKSEFRESPK